MSYFYFEIASVLLPWAMMLIPPIVIPIRSLYGGAKGLSFLCFIFIKRADFGNERILRHELTHYKQQRRYSPYVVTVLLFWHYFVKNRIWRNFGEAYHSCPFELEAFAAMEKTDPLPKMIFLTLKHNFHR
ncbi:MAG: hypothetical protein IPK04_15790 [Bdellovibrionales bacterium]|nr:hypothetical protein [Bdellovibrionales bacterium]